MTGKHLTGDENGMFVIAATPFREDGSLDLDSTRRLVDFYLAENVQGITILGVMGEAPKLSDREQREFASCVIEQAGRRVPVIVGVSSPGIANLVSLSRDVMDAGAAGVMIAGTPGLRTDEQVYRYFASAFDALGDGIPVCVQDYPVTTTVHQSVPVILKLLDDFASFVMFKHEDCPGHRKLSALLRARQDRGRRLSILTGNGGLYVPQELQRGADGVMTGFAFPGMLAEVCARHAAGRVAQAEDLFDHYLPLVRHEQQIGFGLAIRKEILRRRGAIECNAARAPGPALDGDDIDELDHLLGRLRARLEGAGEPVPGGI